MIGARFRSVPAARAKTLVELIRWIDGQGLELEEVHLNRPTLEDALSSS
jgi:hypothetical protein